jgi:hypothetical protein
MLGNLTMTQVGTGNVFRDDGTVRRTTTTGTAMIWPVLERGRGWFAADRDVQFQSGAREQRPVRVPPRDRDRDA